jgi:thiamine biosynthesis lipoprotein
MFANDLMPIYKLFEQIENKCSRFREDSELTLLNQQIEKEITVSSELFSIMKEAERFYHETDRLFNPGILSAIENCGYSKSIEFIKGQKVAVSSLSSPIAATFDPFYLNEHKQTVTLFSKIDLGGIAKGWVIDRAAEVLEKTGYGFINVGGDIRIFGELPRLLNIGIESPFDQSLMISSIQVATGAVATSTSMKRRWQVNEKWLHHLIDPQTGEPTESTIVSATVTAPTALEADVWAKTVLLLGEEKGQKWVNNNGNRSVLIYKSGQIWKGGA